MRRAADRRSLSGNKSAVAVVVVRTMSRVHSTRMCSFFRNFVVRLRGTTCRVVFYSATAHSPTSRLRSSALLDDHALLSRERAKNSLRVPIGFAFYANDEDRRIFSPFRRSSVSLFRVFPGNSDVQAANWNVLEENARAFSRVDDDAQIKLTILARERERARSHRLTNAVAFGRGSFAFEFSSLNNIHIYTGKMEDAF